MSFDINIKQFKSMLQLQQYCEAQYNTILELSKKIQKLEEDKKHLESLLESSVPMLEEQRKEISGYGLGVPSEEIIAQIQLNKFKDLSVTRELTLEETRKVEIFSKILMNLKSGGKKLEYGPKTEELPTAELLKLVRNDDGST